MLLLVYTKNVMIYKVLILGIIIKNIDIYSENILENFVSEWLLWINHNEQ
jgi:hypothetical protein